MTPPIVVAGAGMAGLRAAEQLRAAGWTGRIVVVGDEPRPPYNRPPLSKEALTGLHADGLAAWEERLALRQRRSVADVEWQLGTRVVAADLAGHRLRLEDGIELGYAGLVVATGLRARRLPWADGEAPRFALRTLDDAAALADELRADARLAVVGGGFVGCEVAATATSLGCRVTLVEPLDSCLVRGLGPTVGRAVQEHLSAAGIDVRTGRSATLDPAGRILLDDGSVLPADVVVEAVGSRPNVEWLAGNGLDLTDGVLCDHRLRVAGRDDVVAVGDVARFPNPRYDEVPRRVEHWSMPNDTAKYAAVTLVAGLTGPGAGADDRAPFGPLPSFWSDQLDLRIQSFGAPGLADDTEIIEGSPARLPDGLVAHYHRDGRLVGVVLVNVAGRLHREHRLVLEDAALV